MKNRYKLILAIVGVVVLASAIVYFMVQRADKVSENQLLGGDKDEHGCIGSAGYTWCEAKQKCIREWEESCE